MSAASLALLLALTGTITSATTSSAAPAPAAVAAFVPATSYADSFTKQTFDLINAERVKVGSRPFVWNQKIANVSQDWANQLGVATMDPNWNITNIHRTDAGGNEIPAGSTWYRENIGFNFSPAQLVAWWMNSPGHKAAMLDPRGTDAGLGYVVPTTGPYAGWHLMVSNMAGYATTPAPAPAPAMGYAEEVAINRSGDKASLDVRGWAYDGSKPAESSQVHIYVTTPGGVRTGYAVTANQPRADVNSVMKVTGDHGFSKSFDLAATGTYGVCVYAIGSAGNADFGCRTLRLEGSAPPLGYLDSVAAVLNNGSPVLRAEGWTVDPGTPAASIPVHLYVTDPSGQTTALPFTADKPRADVNAVMGVTGNHGYREDVPITLSGQYTVCAYGLAVSTFNLGNSLLACKTISAKTTPAPVGYMESATANTAAAQASIMVRGWSLDPGTPSASIPVHVYLTAPDGTTNSTAHTANQVRPDVNNVMGSTGNHGYLASIPISKPGNYTACVYGLAVSALSLGNTMLGCQTTTAKDTPAPVGFLDSVSIKSGTLNAKGWSLDPAVPTVSIPVHLYVTYPDGTTKATAYVADNSRPDVNSIIQVTGNHGYDEAIAVTQRGTYTVCAWGLGVAGLSEGNTHLGCRQATY